MTTSDEGLAARVASVRERIALIQGQAEVLREDGAELAARVDALLERCTKKGEFHPDKWAELEEGEQRTILRDLDRVERDVGAELGEDGGFAHALMSKRFPSSPMIVALVVWTIAVFMIDVWQIHVRWNSSVSGAAMTTEVLADWQGAFAQWEESNGRALRAADELAALAPDLPEDERAPVADAYATARDDRAQKESDLLVASQQLAASVEDLGPTERAVLLMVVLLGLLGGCLRVLASISRYVGNIKFRQSWVVYYVVQPFVGAGLAVAVVLLLRVGVLSPASIGGADPLQNVNVLGFYGIAVLTGLFAKNAMDKLSEVFMTLFRTQRRDEDTLNNKANASS